MENTKEMSNLSFAGNLSHKSDIVISQVTGGLHTLNRMRSFFSKLAKMETTFGNNLSKLASTEMAQIRKSTDHDQTTLRDLCVELLADFRAMALHRVRYSNEIFNTVVLSLQKCHTLNEQTLKEIQKNQKQEQLSLEKAEDGILNAKKKVQALEKKTSRFHRKERKNPDKEYREYTDAVRKANIVKRELYNIFLPENLSQLQAIEEERLAVLKTSMQEYRKEFIKLQSLEQKLGTRVDDCLKEVDPSSEVCFFVDRCHKKYGSPPPQKKYKNELTSGISEKETSIHSNKRISGHSHFGVQLDAIYDFEENKNRDIPKIVTECCKAVEDLNGLNVIGIFRLSAGTPDLLKAKEMVDSGNYNFSNMSPHVPAALLKTFFRDLLVPIIPYDLFNDCVAFGKKTRKFNSDKLSNESEFDKIFDRMPKRNKAILIYLSKFLYRVSDFESVNKMGILNLAIVFAPTLAKPKDTDDMNLMMMSIDPLQTFTSNMIVKYGKISSSSNQNAVISNDQTTQNDLDLTDNILDNNNAFNIKESSNSIYQAPQTNEYSKISSIQPFQSSSDSKNPSISSSQHDNSPYISDLSAQNIPPPRPPALPQNLKLEISQCKLPSEISPPKLPAFITKKKSLPPSRPPNVQPFNTVDEPVLPEPVNKKEPDSTPFKLPPDLATQIKEGPDLASLKPTPFPPDFPNKSPPEFKTTQDLSESKQLPSDLATQITEGPDLASLKPTPFPPDFQNTSPPEFKTTQDLSESKQLPSDLATQITEGPGSASLKPIPFPPDFQNTFPPEFKTTQDLPESKQLPSDLATQIKEGAGATALKPTPLPPDFPNKSPPEFKKTQDLPESKQLPPDLATQIKEGPDLAALKPTPLPPDPPIKYLKIDEVSEEKENPVTKSSPLPSNNLNVTENETPPKFPLKFNPNLSNKNEEIDYSPPPITQIQEKRLSNKLVTSDIPFKSPQKGSLTANWAESGNKNIVPPPYPRKSLQLSKRGDLHTQPYYKRATGSLSMNQSDNILTSTRQRSVSDNHKSERKTSDHTKPSIPVFEKKKPFLPPEKKKGYAMPKVRPSKFKWPPDS